MKEIKITPPDGYEIDTMNLSFDRIVFKQIKKELPKRWEDIHLLHGYFVTESCQTKLHSGNHSHLFHKIVFNTKEQAEASIALAQLSQLREIYRQGWKPVYSDNENMKYSIIKYKKEYDILDVFDSRVFLSFESKEVAEQFLDNFRDLIEKASPLLFD